MFSTSEVERLSKEFETRTPQEIIRWAVDTFWPQVALSSSFQTQSMPLLHMASQIRRDQTPIRAHAKILELQEDGLLKVNPLLNWTKADVERYREENNLPPHPLLDKGYRSIGCAPCTVAIGAMNGERAGRWAGRGKIECGLHTDMFKHKDVSELKNDFKIDPLEQL